MATIQEYVNEIQSAVKEEWLRGGYKPEWTPKITFSEAKKYYKVWYHPLPSTSKSIHCFVEIATGNIFKPASWTAPAKGIRGNINNEKMPLLSGQFYNYR